MRTDLAIGRVREMCRSVACCRRDSVARSVVTFSCGTACQVVLERSSLVVVGRAEVEVGRAGLAQRAVISAFRVTRRTCGR